MKPHLLLLVLPVLLVAACGAHETEANEPDPTEATVPAAKPEAPKSPEFIGVISSKKSQTIAADFDATILKIDIRNGQPVRKGDIVAELDDTELKAKLDEAKGQLQRAKGAAARASTAYSNAERRAKTERRLINAGAAAPEAFKNISAEAGQFGADGTAAAGDVATSKATITDLETKIAKAKVTAPFDGVVAVVKLHQGEHAGRGAAIARVFDPYQLVVRFAVPRKHVSLIKIGAPIELVTQPGNHVVPATVTVRDDTADPSIDLTVFEAIIDPNTRTDEIRVGDNGHVRIAGALR